MRENDGADDAKTRRQEIATILAAGLLRYCRVARKHGTPRAAESPDSSQNYLGSADTSRLPVPTGSGGYDPREP